jgi:hypothetical protein
LVPVSHTAVDMAYKPDYKYTIVVSEEMRDCVNSYYHDDPGYWLSVPADCRKSFTTIGVLAFCVAEWTRCLDDNGGWNIRDYGKWLDCGEENTVDLSGIKRDPPKEE